MKLFNALNLVAALAIASSLVCSPAVAGPFTESETKISNVDIDPITGDVRVDTVKAKVHDDFTDADRNVVVGKKIPINQPVFKDGKLIGHKVGFAWKSPSGKWHYDVTIKTINETGGIDTTKILRMKAK